MGGRVTEQTKASVAMRTVAGSNLGHGRHFCPGRHLSDRAWQIQTGAQIKNSAKTNIHTRVNKSTVPYLTVPQANDLSS